MYKRRTDNQSVKESNHVHHHLELEMSDGRGAPWLWLTAAFKGYLKRELNSGLMVQDAADVSLKNSQKKSGNISFCIHTGLEFKTTSSKGFSFLNSIEREDWSFIIRFPVIKGHIMIYIFRWPLCKESALCKRYIYSRLLSEPAVKRQEAGGNNESGTPVHSSLKIIGVLYPFVKEGLFYA